MKKALFGIVAAAGLASAANADLVQTWRAVVVPNDPSGNSADPSTAGASSGTTLNVANGQSVLFILSLNLTDTTIPAGANAASGSILRGIGAATSQLVGTANANGSWNPVNSSGGGIYNGNGTSGIAIPGSGTASNANQIVGLGVLSNGLLTGGGAAGTGISNTEGVDILGILWQPNNYSNRSVTFVGSPFGSANDNVLWFRNGGNGAGGQSYPVTPTGTTTFTVNIVPAPASLALLGMGGLIAGRRRR
jgi:hypothetical protein